MRYIHLTQGQVFVASIETNSPLLSVAFMPRIIIKIKFSLFSISFVSLLWYLDQFAVSVGRFHDRNFGSTVRLAVCGQLMYKIFTEIERGESSEGLIWEWHIATVPEFKTKK